LRPALEYAARLRLPAETEEEAIAATVDRVLAAIELEHRSRLRIRRLSGGQRKRASLGIELLLAPPVLLLDEPTSGLDPELEATTMKLLRRLAREGRAVLTTTHATASLELADFIVVIAAGQIAYLGTPAGALRYFKVPDPDLIFKRLKEQEASGWALLYRSSADCAAAARRAPPSRGRG
jgi:ABC-type multidrug transport system ATPase subunit